MPSDSRTQAARYYDLTPFPDDLPFYEKLIPSPQASLLELGCGTGRILVPLAERCGFACGLDISPAMLEVCRRRADEARLPPGRIETQRGDISSFRLGRRFDLIIAPFRVFQALETDAEVDACLRCIADHLDPQGTCVLSMFNPKWPREQLPRAWRQEEEVEEWQLALPGGDRLICSSIRQNLDPENLVIYPDMVYRLFRDGRMIDHFIEPIAMRCWYADEILALLVDRGFCIRRTWGGYHGETFGEGPELLVQFGLAE